ncbi:hypothetical protein [Romboutsia lituseburensis]|uniref:hypothetical protein n=1 Tax=Romboutsia lituseburensis TaxID=1537 RepID=UPI00215A4758|nr:hypothetical protein [Romboutsia lituseburensis]MCR8745231.1 hypothetical protein [Romboutsia lituseburensis]
MSKTFKSKKVVLKLAEEHQNKLYEALDNYDIDVIEAMSKELETLNAEYEELKLTANKITSFNRDEYFKNQARLKELPQLILQLERDKVKAHADKEGFKDSICRNIKDTIGTEIQEEYNNNLNVLLTAFDKTLIELISIYKDMEQLTSSYNTSMYEVLHTKGIYMSMSHISGVNEIKDSHNMGGGRLYLNYAE